MKHLRFPVHNQIHFTAWILCLYAPSGSKHVMWKYIYIYIQRFPAPPPSLNVLFCVSLQDRIPLMMIKGLSLFQTSAIVATKRLSSGVCIKVYNCDACKLGKSVSCNFSASKEGVPNENGWLSRILKATGDRIGTHPTLQEVEHTLLQSDLALESSLAPSDPAKSNAISVPGHFLPRKARVFLFIGTKRGFPRSCSELWGGWPGRQAWLPQALDRVVQALGAEPASLLVCPLETHAWLSCLIGRELSLLSGFRRLSPF